LITETLEKDSPPIMEAHEHSLDKIRNDFHHYQELLDDISMRSWMADQLHENIRYLLEFIDARQQ